MSDEVLIRVEGVAKKFCRSLKKSLWYGVQDIFCDLNPFAKNGVDYDLSSVTRHSSLRADEFWAVDNVSFELQRGECLGLIGRNGAGKTTLLKMLNGLIKPDKGRVEMRGRVGALIALGAGFNPILTGRENIYVNGSVLGLSKLEIDEKLDEIIDFSDIREFIDTPVQSYSSGMQVRLGFAVATALKPDVLLLDEVLAVGDAAFRAKCYQKVGQLMKQAGVIFVSHSMEQVSRICDTVLLLDRGSVRFFGPAIDGCTIYLKDAVDSPTARESFNVAYAPVRSIRLTQVEGLAAERGVFRFAAEVVADRSVRILPRLQIFDSSGNLAAETGKQDLLDLGECSKIMLTLGPLALNPGTYSLSLCLYDAKHQELLAWTRNQASFKIEGDRLATANYVIHPKYEVATSATPCAF